MSASKNVLSSMLKNYIHEGKQFSEDIPIALLTVNRVGVIAGRGSRAYLQIWAKAAGTQPAGIRSLFRRRPRFCAIFFSV